jgi:hypothetical protein
MNLKVIIMIIIIMIIIIIISSWILYIFLQRKIIRNLFIKTIKNLDKYNIEYWVDFGTLLGIERDKDIILGDNDADICIVNTPENLNKFYKNNIGKFAYNNIYRVYNLSIFGNFFVDLYIPEIVKNQYKIPTGELIDIKLIQPIQKKTIELNGHKIKVSLPNKIKDTLINRYGNNWNKKSRHWYTLYLDLPRLKKFGYL